MTYTILASDPAQQLLGVATASRSLAVGAGVPSVRVGVGAVASQAYTNRALRKYVLDGIQSGTGPAEVFSGLGDVDEGITQRQLAVIDADGEIAVYTGSECTEWAGSKSGAGFVVAGNFLPGAHVLEAMTDEYLADPYRTGISAFARRLHRALVAGECAGGDSRGRQSAALVIGAGSSLSSPTGQEAPLAIDLRVDDHTDPVNELGRLLAKTLIE